MVLSGHVKNGKIVLDELVALPEGTAVSVAVASRSVPGMPADPGVRQTMKNDLPVMLVNDRTPPIDPAQIRRSLEEEGF
jgi:hypothetical protein